MRKLLRRLACWIGRHEWELHRTDITYEGKPIGVFYRLQCRHCDMVSEPGYDE